MQVVVVQHLAVVAAEVAIDTLSSVSSIAVRSEVHGRSWLAHVASRMGVAAVVAG